MMTAFSRYQYCIGYRNTNGVLYLDERERFGYRNETDNSYHTVKDGDTLWGVAHLYFQGMRRPGGLWWVIAEFQPTPIIDPTIRLQAGAILVIPSQRLIKNELFSEDRRKFH